MYGDCSGGLFDLQKRIGPVLLEIGGSVPVSLEKGGQPFHVHNLAVTGLFLEQTAMCLEWAALRSDGQQVPFAVVDIRLQVLLLFLKHS